MLADALPDDVQLDDRSGELSMLALQGPESLGLVELVLAFEEAFEIEFPDNLLNRKSFASISAIEKTVDVIKGSRKVA